MKRQMLWIGCLESDKEFENKSKKGYNLASAQVSQMNILNGIEHLTGECFDSINGSVLPPFPVYKDKTIEEVIWSHKPGAFNISVGYENLKFVNRLTCKQSMIKAAKRWIKERYTGGELLIFVYSMRSSVMETACYIKDRIKNAKIYLIVTDLPQFMDLGESKLKVALKKVDWVQIKRMQPKFDGFILYASKMAEFLQIPDDKWVLMEGSYNAAESASTFEFMQEHKRKALMYSGKLDEQYGIRLLLDSFMSIPDSEIELWLTGGGNAEAYIRECTQKDQRIKFFGFLPTRYDVLAMQSQASLLINMRLPSEKASNYCFPSKLFEYMATGVPVLSFKLGGIPEEYYPHLFIIDEESESAIRDAIVSVIDISDEERSRKGEQARRFIVENKTIDMQCKKIMRYIASVRK